MSEWWMFRCVVTLKSKFPKDWTATNSAQLKCGSGRNVWTCGSWAGDLSGIKIQISTIAIPAGKLECVIPWTKVCLMWKEHATNLTGCSWFKVKLHVMAGIPSVSLGFQGGLCVTRENPAKTARTESFCSKVIKLMRFCRMAQWPKGQSRKEARKLL